MPLIKAIKFRTHEILHVVPKKKIQPATCTISIKYIAILPQD